MLRKKMKYELYYNLYKSVMRNKKLNVYEVSFIDYFMHSRLLKKFYLSKYKYSCNLTGRYKGLYRFFGLSRLSIKKMTSLRYITGIRKSSW